MGIYILNINIFIMDLTDGIIVLLGLALVCLVVWNAWSEPEPEDGGVEDGANARTCADTDADGTEDLFNCDDSENSLTANPAGVACPGNACTTELCCTGGGGTGGGDGTGDGGGRPHMGVEHQTDQTCNNPDIFCEGELPNWSEHATCQHYTEEGDTHGISLTGRQGALTGLSYAGGIEDEPTPWPASSGKLHWVLNGALNPNHNDSAELIIKGTKADGTFGECPHKTVGCLGNSTVYSRANSGNWPIGTSCQVILDSFPSESLGGPSGGLAWCANINNNGTIQPGNQRDGHINEGGCYLGITDITDA